MSYLLIVISNQKGVSKGLMTKNDLNEVTSKLLRELPQIDDVFYCTDIDSYCTKPKPGMIYNAHNKYYIDMNRSWMIGDDERDIMTGKRAGLKTILISRDLSIDTDADFIVSSISEASEIIKKYFIR